MVLKASKGMLAEFGAKVIDTLLLSLVLQVLR
jgi:hypothetical protein